MEWYDLLVLKDGLSKFKLRAVGEPGNDLYDAVGSSKGCRSSQVRRPVEVEEFDAAKATLFELKGCTAESSFIVTELLQY